MCCNDFILNSLNIQIRYHTIGYLLPTPAYIIYQNYYYYYCGLQCRMNNLRCFHSFRNFYALSRKYCLFHKLLCDTHAVHCTKWFVVADGIPHIRNQTILRWNLFFINWHTQNQKSAADQYDLGWERKSMEWKKSVMESEKFTAHTDTKDNQSLSSIEKFGILRALATYIIWDCLHVIRSSLWDTLRSTVYALSIELFWFSPFSHANQFFFKSTVVMWSP